MLQPMKMRLDEKILHGPTDFLTLIFWNQWKYVRLFSRWSGMMYWRKFHAAAGSLGYRCLLPGLKHPGFHTAIGHDHRNRRSRSPECAVFSSNQFSRKRSSSSLKVLSFNKTRAKWSSSQYRNASGTASFFAINCAIWIGGWWIPLSYLLILALAVYSSSPISTPSCSWGRPEALRASLSLLPNIGKLFELRFFFTYWMWTNRDSLSLRNT